MSVAVSLEPIVIQAPKPWGRYLRHECSSECRAKAFWALVDWSGGPEACWPWKGTIGKATDPGHSDGYGSFCHAGVVRGAHRESLIIAGKLKPRSRKYACHKPICPNRACVNPNHLYAGTALDNARDTLLTGTSNLGKRIPNGPVVAAKLDVYGLGEDWLSLRCVVPGAVLNPCAACDGVGRETSADKISVGWGDDAHRVPEYYVSECWHCGGTGLTRGSEVTRIVVRTDADDREPMDRLWDSSCQLPSLFEEVR